MPPQHLRLLHGFIASHFDTLAVTGMRCRWSHWLDGSAHGCRQDQVAAGGQAASRSTAGAAPSGTAVPNPAASSDLNSLPTGTAASNAASQHGQGGQGMQAQQPKAVPSSATSVQAGSFGELGIHNLQIDDNASSPVTSRI